MANSQLQGKYWELPEELKNHFIRIKNSYKGDKNFPGYQRLENLISDSKITYEQLKRVKNFFDNHSTNGKTDYMDKKQDTEFILNGGTKMKHFVNKTLEDARNNIEGTKKIKNSTNMIGNHYQKNSFMNGVKKDIKISNDSKKIKQKTSHQGSISESEAIYEIRNMQNIINIFTKNKELWQTDK